MSFHLLIKSNIKAISLCLLSWILSTVVNEIKHLDDDVKLAWQVCVGLFYAYIQIISQFSLSFALAYFL